MVKSIGGWYRTFLKGYAIIGVIVTYFDFLNATYNMEQGVISFGFNLVYILIVILLLSLSLIPVLLQLDYSQPKKIEWVKKIAAKYILKDDRETSNQKQ